MSRRWLKEGYRFYLYGDDISGTEEEIKGSLTNMFDDKYWRFEPVTFLSCKDCRMIADKLSELNAAMDADLSVSKL